MPNDVDKSLPESEISEWKWSWRDEYMKWMSAFAYTSGGTLNIGVNDDGYVVGLENYRKLLEELPNKFRDKLHITPFVRLRHADSLGQISDTIPCLRASPRKPLTSMHVVHIFPRTTSRRSCWRRGKRKFLSIRIQMDGMTISRLK